MKFVTLRKSKISTVHHCSLTLVHGPEARAALEDVPYRLDIPEEADTDGQPLARPPATVVTGGPHLTRVGETPHRELA